MQRADPVSTKEQPLDAQRQLYDSRTQPGPPRRCVRVSRYRSVLSREAGSLISHTKILRLLVHDAGRGVPPEVDAALLTFEGWAVSLIAARSTGRCGRRPNPRCSWRRSAPSWRRCPMAGWSAFCVISLPAPLHGPVRAAPRLPRGGRMRPEPNGVPCRRARFATTRPVWVCSSHERASLYPSSGPAQDARARGGDQRAAGAGRQRRPVGPDLLGRGRGGPWPPGIASS